MVHVDLFKTLVLQDTTVYCILYISLCLSSPQLLAINWGIPYPISHFSGRSHV